MNISKARKKSRRIRQERMLLLIYALAVTAAFFVYVYNNNTVNASTPANTILMEQVPEEFSDIEDSDDMAVLDEEDIEDDDNVDFVADEDLELPEELTQSDTEENEEIENQNKDEVIIVQKGDSFINILTGKGLEYNQASLIYNTLKKVYDARKINVGQALNINFTPATEESQPPVINRIMIEPVSGTRYIVERNDKGDYEASEEQDELLTEIKTVKGTINGSVSSAMSAAGIPSKVTGNFINIFSFSVDFRRDVKAGDQFEVRYERQLAPDGKVVKSGDIIYAALQLGRQKTELYRFKDKNGHVEYYDEKGMALKKNLDRKPLEFKRARISSRYGRRFHPILKEYRRHDGVDYAAPSGSKVYASGDGVVKMAKWYGGYGNFIYIRHNSEYSTGYGHMKGFAAGIRPGVRVKQGQLIGYVGSTGRSTGPHLHFEIVKNGTKIDPLTVKAATGENLEGNNLKEFKKVVAQIKATIEQEKNVAANDETALEKSAVN